MLEIAIKIKAGTRHFDFLDHDFKGFQAKVLSVIHESSIAT